MDRGGRLQAGSPFVEVGPQLVYGSASGQPRGMIELAGLARTAVSDARGTPCRLQVSAGKGRWSGMFADHGGAGSLSRAA